MSNYMSDASGKVLPQTVGERKGFWGRWLNLTAPARNELTTASPHLREALRKAELTGYFLFVLGCCCIPDFIFAFTRPAALAGSLSVIIGFLLFLVLIAFLNRRGKTHLAATILVGCIICSVMFVIGVALKNSHATDLLPTYDFFVYPIIIGSLFIPRRWIWIFTAVSIAFVFVDLLFLPHPLDIEQVRATPTIVLWLLRPAIMISVSAIVGWLGARSVEQAILRADRAEELAAAERQVAMQTHMIAKQKAQLEAEMMQILLVHQEAAAGNYDVRAPVQTPGIIWQIGRSLNNLLARYEQFAREQQEYGIVKADIEQIALYIEKARRGERPAYPPCRSLAAKRLLYAMGMPVPRPTGSDNFNEHSLLSTSDKPSDNLSRATDARLQGVLPQTQEQQAVSIPNPFPTRRRPFDLWRQNH